MNIWDKDDFSQQLVEDINEPINNTNSNLDFTKEQEEFVNGNEVDIKDIVIKVR